MDNPFAAPSTPSGSPPAPAVLRPAGAAPRVGARLLDLSLPYLIVAVAGPAAGGSEAVLAVARVATGATAAGILMWQWTRTGLDGTTFGKRWTNMRVVDLAGAPPGFARGVVAREWVPAAVVAFAAGVQPLLGAAVLVVDMAFLFAPDGRALHDRLAGTRVVRGRVPEADGDPDDANLDPDLLG